MNQRIIIILVALVFAIILTLILFNHKQGKITPQSQPVIVALVAAKDLKFGMTLQAGDFTWRPLDKKEIATSDVITQETREKDLIGSKLQESVLKDHLILQNMLISKGTLSPLASVLMPGMRAFTVEINASMALAGLIKPGDFVDIILTSKETGGGTTITKTILHNVHVIAVDQDILYVKSSSKEDKVQQRASKQITLELTPKEAELVAAGKANGILSLSLTVPSDSQTGRSTTIEEMNVGVSLYHGEKTEESSDGS